jgi:hypothetical protein
MNDMYHGIDAISSSIIITIVVIMMMTIPGVNIVWMKMTSSLAIGVLGMCVVVAIAVVVVAIIIIGWGSTGACILMIHHHRSYR